MMKEKASKLLIRVAEKAAKEAVCSASPWLILIYTHKLLGSVSGDNRKGSSTLQITYSYEQN